MGLSFAETSVHKIDTKKYDENFSKIVWDKSLLSECEECGEEICTCESEVLFIEENV